MKILKAAIEELQVMIDRDLVDAVEQIERETWKLREEIETALRPVRDYLHHQPIDQVGPALTALLEVERLLLKVPHCAEVKDKIRRRRGPPR